MRPLLSRAAVVLAVVVAVPATGCSLRERLPDIPVPSLPLPRGDSSPELPPGVGAPGSGSYLFHLHCSKCHASPPAPAFAGIMAGVPPIDQTTRARSLDRDFLHRIIAEGGAGVGRRSSMPSFKDVLTDAEIRRIVSYLHGESA